MIITIIRLDNVLYGADEMCDPDKDDLVADVNDLENIDSFHSVGIGRFKLTEVGLMIVKMIMIVIMIGRPHVCRRPAETDHNLPPHRRHRRPPAGAGG